MTNTLTELEKSEMINKLLQIFESKDIVLEFINKYKEFIIQNKNNLTFGEIVYKCIELERKNGKYIFHLWRFSNKINIETISVYYLNRAPYKRAFYIISEGIEECTIVAESKNYFEVVLDNDQRKVIEKSFIYDIKNKTRIEEIKNKTAEIQQLEQIY